MKEEEKSHASSSGKLAENLRASKLHFDLNDELEQLKREQSWSQSGRIAKTLVKHPDFRIILTLIKEGKRLEEHKAEGRLSIQTLKGRMRLRLGDQTLDLPAGHLLALERALPHDVEALEECAFLITIAWPK